MPCSIRILEIVPGLVERLSNFDSIDLANENGVLDAVPGKNISSNIFDRLCALTYHPEHVGFVLSTLKEVCMTEVQCKRFLDMILGRVIFLIVFLK